MVGYSKSNNNPLIDLENADRDLFDSIASKYALKDIIKSTSICRKYQLLYAVSPLLNNNSRIGTIIDIACGAGAPAKYLQGYYDKYIGVDYSSQMIELAKNLNKDIPDVEFICSNIKELKREVLRADVILAVGAFHHMTGLPEVFNSLKAIAKSGAYIIAIEPQRANPIVQFLRWFRGILDRSYSEEQHYFSKSELHKLFDDNGLIEIETKYQGYLTPPFAQVILKPQAIFYPLAKIAMRSQIFSTSERT
jgi:SAM-dependent methyltransferase